MKCQICNKEFNSYRSLANHISRTHDISSKDYYDTYVKQPREGVCEFCSGDTQFMNISKGYASSCSATNCKSQKAKVIRQKNALNKEKHEAFIHKVKNNQTRIWNERRVSGYDQVIREKIKETQRNTIDSMTHEERKESFGWMNKLSPEELNRWKEEVMLNTGMFKWYKEASDEQLQELYNKRCSSRWDVIIDLVEKYKKDLFNKDKYYAAVDAITNQTYFTYINKIDPNRLRGKGYHLDHKYSKIQGFMNNIDPNIIGSVVNLEILSEQENVSKSGKCSVEINTLLEEYYKWEKDGDRDDTNQSIQKNT